MEDDLERTSRLENQAIEALATLIEDHGYDEEDFERLVEAAKEQVA
jgi:hypothetical protein